jgi:outer membrane protein OmpA-like peptidoglycan-associated protein
MNKSVVKTAFWALALLLLPVQSIRSYQLEEDSVQNEVTLEAREKLTPDLTAPPVRFAIRNKDPQTGLFYTVDEGNLADVSAWQIQIFDRRRRKVSFIQGQNNPPPLVSWSGISDKGEPLPDGFYTARFGWQDSAKRAYATKAISFTLLTALEIRGLVDWKLKFIYTDEGLAVSIDEGMVFKPGESEIQTEALPSLLQIARFLKTCSKNMVTVRGYTDSSGSARMNSILSRERANRVYRYLVDAGINPNRLTYEGMGPARAVAPNTTEAGRVRNRRVEVVVLKTTV